MLSPGPLSTRNGAGTHLVSRNDGIRVANRTMRHKDNGHWYILNLHNSLREVDSPAKP